MELTLYRQRQSLNRETKNISECDENYEENKSEKRARRAGGRRQF